MTIRFIGDVHGKYGAYKTILKKSPPSIQVGDMGVGFLKWPHGDPAVNPPYDKMVKGGHRFIRGNHDNPAVCKQHTQWIPDGHVENDMMFVGGADSIDKALRIEGFSWWPDEQLSTKELGDLVEKYDAIKPRIMVTHDCPQSIAQHITLPLLFKSTPPLETTRTRQALEQMLVLHKPELWVFGHWHVSVDYVLDGTRFVCLAELEYKDFDL